MRLAIVLIIPLLFGCNSNSETDLENVGISEVEFRVLAYEPSGGGNQLNESRFTAKRIEIFTNQASYFERLAEFDLDAATVVDTDFEEKRVALISMGQRSSTGGYSIEVGGVELFEEYAQLEIKTSIPGSNCPVLGAFSTPFMFVEIDSTNELIVQERFEILDCL